MLTSEEFSRIKSRLKALQTKNETREPTKRQLNEERVLKQKAWWVYQELRKSRV